MSRQRCATPVCRHAPWAHQGPAGGATACRLCSCSGWLASKPHEWRRDVWDAWFTATLSWLDHREVVAIGYPAEEAEFEERHPRPRLADFMVGMSPGTDPEDLARLYDFDICRSCNGTGHERGAA